MADPKKRVVFIDDELSKLIYYIEATEEAGYEVVKCHSADEGIEYIRNRHHDIDIVILDMRMPSPRALLAQGSHEEDETGLWLLGEARDILKKIKLPVIVLSNRASPDLSKQISELLQLPEGQVIVTSKNIETTAVMLPGRISKMCSHWPR